MEMVDHPFIWTDGSRVDYPTGGFEVAGSGVFFRAPEATMLEAVWGATEEYGEVLDGNCRVFMSVPGTLQSVQRAEFWGAILALQAYYPCHLGIDNLNVARIIGRLLDRGSLGTPLPLVPDGDLVAVVQHMLIAWGLVRLGLLRLKVMLLNLMLSRGGFGLRIDLVIMRLMLLLTWEGGASHSGLLMLGGISSLPEISAIPLLVSCIGSSFMVAISRVSVNHDGRGGTATDSLVWDRGGVKKRRKIEVGVNVDLAALPGPPGFLDRPSMQVPSGCISGSDIAAWP